MGYFLFAFQISKRKESLNISEYIKKSKFLGTLSSFCNNTTDTLCQNPVTFTNLVCIARVWVRTLELFIFFLPFVLYKNSMLK